MERERASSARLGARLSFLRILLITITAAVPAAVLAGHVYGDFHRVRERILGAPVPAGEPAVLSVPLPDVPELAGAPVALISTLRNDRADDLKVSVGIDGVEIAAAVIPPASSRRVDASTTLSPGAHALTLTASRSGWTLETVEFANVHGFTDEPFDLVVVPRTRAAPTAPLVLVVLIFGGLVALGAWSPPLSRRWRWPRWVAAAFALLLCTAVLGADQWTPFAILLSARTFVLTLALLYAGELVVLARALTPHVRAGFRWLNGLNILRHVKAIAKDVLPVLPHLVIVATMLNSVASFWSPGVGFTRFIAFGDQFAARAVPALAHVPHAVEVNSSGYDGQFYAQMAFDPLLRDPKTLAALDNPDYRARRMFFPLVAYVAGFGQPAWVLQAYAILNVVCWVLLAMLLCVWLPPGRWRAFAAWAGCLIGNGWISSVRLALTDGPSLLLIALAVLALERGRRGVSAGVLGLATLGRETSVLGAVILLPNRLRDFSLRRVLTLAVAVLPFAVWLLYLRSLGLSDEGGTNNLAVPVVALAGKWTSTVQELAVDGWESWARVSLVCLIGMTVQAGYLFWQRRWTSAWWRIGATHAVLMLVLGTAVWDGYPGAATRALLPLAVAFNIELMHAGRSFWPLWILGNLGVLTSSEFIPVPYFGSLI